MPNIATFIAELLSEEKYDSAFNDRIGERIENFNAAQLQGMYTHLIKTSKNAKSEMWINANQEIIQKIEGLMRVRVEEAKLEQKLLDEVDLKEKQRKDALREKKREGKRVMKMIEDAAYERAAREIKEQEYKRATAERGELQHRLIDGENRRNYWWIRIIISTIIFIVIISVFVKIVYILLALIFIILLVSGILLYKSYKFGVVVPLVVSDEELERQISLKAQTYKKKAIEDIAENERKFNEQQIRDHEERKRIKKQKKKRLKYEAELLEMRRLEQIAMAKEIVEKRSSSSSQVSSLMSKSGQISGAYPFVSQKIPEHIYADPDDGSVVSSTLHSLDIVPESEGDEEEGGIGAKQKYNNSYHNIRNNWNKNNWNEGVLSTDEDGGVSSIDNASIDNRSFSGDELT
eukprot:gene8319-11255_t